MKRFRGCWLIFEILGLIAIFGATGWQLFYEEPIQIIANDSAINRIETKLDYMFMALSDIYMDNDKTLSHEEKIKNLLNHFGYDELYQDIGSMGRSVNDEVMKNQHIRGWIFMSGSLLLIGSRIWEIMVRK